MQENAVALVLAAAGAVVAAFSAEAPAQSRAVQQTITALGAGPGKVSIEHSKEPSCWRSSASPRALLGSPGGGHLGPGLSVSRPLAALSWNLLCILSSEGPRGR